MRTKTLAQDASMVDQKLPQYASDATGKILGAIHTIEQIDHQWFNTSLQTAELLEAQIEEDVCYRLMYCIHTQHTSAKLNKISSMELLALQQVDITKDISDLLSEGRLLTKHNLVSVASSGAKTCLLRIKPKPTSKAST